jgi:hypothetical protein
MALFVTYTIVITLQAMVLVFAIAEEVVLHLTHVHAQRALPETIVNGVIAILVR